MRCRCPRLSVLDQVLFFGELNFQRGQPLLDDVTKVAEEVAAVEAVSNRLAW